MKLNYFYAVKLPRREDKKVSWDRQLNRFLEEKTVLDCTRLPKLKNSSLKTSTMCQILRFKSFFQLRKSSETNIKYF